jgi:hypothetical protein
MNKQMTPAEIELLQQSLAWLAPISGKAALVEVECGIPANDHVCFTPKSGHVRCS